jgi:hypothetical protein
VIRADYAPVIVRRRANVQAVGPAAVAALSVARAFL